MRTINEVEKIINSRYILVKDLTLNIGNTEELEIGEGGCGVVGVACTTQICGRNFLQPLIQMKNRGNGKGGGIAVLGLSAAYLGVSQKVLNEDYILQIAYLDPKCQSNVEEEFILPKFDIHFQFSVQTIPDYKTIGLEVPPPQLYRYFVRVKDSILKKFMDENNFIDELTAEDEFVYQNTYSLNKKFYASEGEKKAFVVSHGKNMLIFKLVGYAEQVIQYYKLEDFPAYVWIGHHRYPTKGRVWHPGGAHPFIGLNEALIHNGEFSNYHSVSEYLAQRNIYPLFLTDTEVSVYLFDLFSRVYKYPTEYVIEALAPTTERDFMMLSEDKQRIYRELQLAHFQGSPDGPWFFIVGRSLPQKQHLELLGITDTSMLRPQVFALQDGEENIGIVASERQAIDALLKNLSAEDKRFAAKADIYWNARGGSYNDGGAFIFNIDISGSKPVFKCTDKFGNNIVTPCADLVDSTLHSILVSALDKNIEPFIFNFTKNVTTIQELCLSIQKHLKTNTKYRQKATYALTAVLDPLHLTPFYYDGRVRESLEFSIFEIFRSFTSLSINNSNEEWALINYSTYNDLRSPLPHEQALIIDIADFPAEGDGSAALFIVDVYKKGWKHIYSFDWHGQRFCGSGLGSNSDELRIDVYGNPGDYLGSGLDGAEIYVHAAAQDQVAQLMKRGKLVIYGDVGQAFMYGAKGGSVYVLGNAAGRPLINAVGRPRVIINGTALDYLAESFMAGDPLNGGGFIILGGLRFDASGRVVPLPTPYYGGNLFSLASGGAIYVRDPYQFLGDDQLHGGKFGPFSEKDAVLIQPYLK